MVVHDGARCLPDALLRPQARGAGRLHATLGCDLVLQVLNEARQAAAASQRCRRGNAAAGNTKEALIEAHATAAHHGSDFLGITLIAVPQSKEGEPPDFRCRSAVPSRHLHQRRNGCEVTGRVLYVLVLG